MSIDLLDAASADAVYSALVPEVMSQPSDKIRIILSLSGNELHIIIFSDGLSSLRAVVNSFLRLITAVEEVLKVGNNLSIT